MAALEQKEELIEHDSDCIGWMEVIDLQYHVAEVVSIVGRNISPHHDEICKLTFEDGTGAKYWVMVPQPDFEGFAKGAVIEVKGLVLGAKKISLRTWKDWGTEFKLKVWSKFMAAKRQFPNLF